ncbi:hypothetical protein [Parablautia sp. Marseille-Q6255]|uniref:hypothetical protein n=1 Tax=Parablautia sp. Marseille-Q6255 TaxID=3039593 RepID=UPI0024BCA35B|nr:hypothetical protein [Parablautia sp. Marseille-Q6255]
MPSKAQREKINGEEFKRIVYENILADISKAFSSLLYDFFYLDDFEEIVEEYAKDMERAIQTAVKEDKSKIIKIRKDQ